MRKTEEEAQIKRCLPLVKKIAEQMRRHGGILDYDDLMQEGMIAVWSAGQHFCEGKGYKLSTFMNDAIRNHLLNAIRNYNRGQPETADLSEAMDVVDPAGDDMAMWERVQGYLVKFKELLTPVQYDALTSFAGLNDRYDSLADMAEQTNMDYNNVYYHKQQAAKILRKKSEEWFGG